MRSGILHFVQNDRGRKDQNDRGRDQNDMEGGAREVGFFAGCTVRIVRFFTSFRMTGEGFRMTGEGFRMTGGEAFSMAFRGSAFCRKG